MSPGRKMVLFVKWRALLVVAAAALVLICTQGTAFPAAKADLVDINAATQAELEAVKGIGPVTAKKIIDNRPYKSLADLKKAGLSSKEIKEYKSSLGVKPAPTPVSPAAAPQAAKTVEPATAKPVKEVKSPIIPTDMNTADQKAIEALPGIGPALAKRIMAARPFQSIDDLSKVKGMTKTKMAALKDKVTVGAAPPPTPAAKPAAEHPAAKPAAEPPGAKPAPAAEKPAAPSAPAAKPQPGVVPPASKLAPGEKININTATLEELDKLPEIGPVKAKAIIEGRPYQTPEDIMKVKGIKEGIFDKVKDHITVK
jgi:competence protein ComEA